MWCTAPLLKDRAPSQEQTVQLTVYSRCLSRLKRLQSGDREGWPRCLRQTPQLVSVPHAVAGNETRYSGLRVPSRPPENVPYLILKLVLVWSGFYRINLAIL